jgi:hypothetical protein
VPRVTTRRAAPQVAFDELSTLLPDWQISLRAKGRRPGTVTSYLTVAKTFNAFLVANGMPTSASAITREHIEHSSITPSPRPSRSTTEPFSSCSSFWWMTARLALARWNG